MRISWDELAGSPKKAEQLFDLIVRAEYGDRVRTINGSGGDGGRDAWIEDIRRAMEFKSWTNWANPSAQVVRSLKRAVGRTSFWVLVAPVRPTSGTCSGSTASKAAPAFTGPGPHPMALAEYTGTKEIDVPTFVYIEPHLPYGWDPDDHHQAQLLVCVHVTTTRDTGRKITCSYTNMPDIGSTPFEFDVFESAYRVTVRETRSGRVVGEFCIPGTVGDETSSQTPPGYG